VQKHAINPYRQKETISDRKELKPHKTITKKKDGVKTVELGTMKARHSQTTKVDILFKMKQQCKSYISSDYIIPLAFTLTVVTYHD